MTEVVAVHAPDGAVADVVFVHGLGGDPRKTWRRKDSSSFWPRWLAEDVEDVAVWSVGYDAWSSGWRGRAMSLADRAINLLAQLQSQDIGQRPLCFVTHSMGGLLVKEMLLHAADGRTDFASFASATKGIVFLGTPHTGPGLARVVDALGIVYRGTPAVEDLKRNGAHLRQLNDRYRDWVGETGIANLIFFETHPTKGVQVVDESAANPGLPRVRPIPVDTNHIDICKPSDRNSMVYSQVKRFVTGIRNSYVHGNVGVGESHSSVSAIDVHGSVTRIALDGGNARIEQDVPVVPVVTPMDQVDEPQAGIARFSAQPELFVGRDEDLARLHAAMTSKRTGAAVVNVVHGLSGIGKSALAARYAEAHRGEYSLLWWVSADTSTAIDAGLAQLAVSLQPVLGELPLEQQVEHALNWLATHQDWLLILDNLTTPADAAKLLERLPSGQVLITSRRTTGWRNIARPLPLAELEPAEAVEMLTSILGLQGPADLLGDVRKLCAELGYLPLAIGQAGAYIAETGITPTAYLDLLDRHPAAMYETPSDRDAQRTMARLWRVTLDHLHDTPLAGRILRVLAWFAPDGIPAALLTDLGETSAVNKAIGRLAACAMITQEGDLIRVHRLVQAVTRSPDRDDPHRASVDIEQARDYAASALASALGRLGVFAPDHLPVFKGLLPHAQALLNYSIPDNDTPDTTIILDKIGRFLMDQDAVADAVTYLDRCLASCERIYGLDHPDTMTSRNTLAYVYRVAGDVGRAIPLLEAILADRERALGPEHSSTLASRNDLVYAYRYTGDVGRAIPLLEAILADRERALGPEHPSTLASRNNLASAYYAINDSGRAIRLFEATLAGRERVLGPDHPDTLNSRNNLAGAYEVAGYLGRAIPLLEANLADSERVLGPDHPDTLNSYNNLGHAYRAAGYLVRPIPPYEAIAADVDPVLGSNHGDSLNSQSAPVLPLTPQVADPPSWLRAHVHCLSDEPVLAGRSVRVSVEVETEEQLTPLFEPVRLRVLLDAYPAMVEQVSRIAWLAVDRRTDPVEFDVVPVEPGSLPLVFRIYRDFDSQLLLEITAGLPVKHAEVSS